MPTSIAEKPVPLLCNHEYRQKHIEMHIRYILIDKCDLASFSGNVGEFLDLLMRLDEIAHDYRYTRNLRRYMFLDEQSPGNY